jgi:RNase H-fold protein (predicted Holliday junction resolvase)
VRDFIENLRKQINISVEFRDERLSTRYARSLMKSAGIKKDRNDDAMAAAVILQGYLDEEHK